MKSATPKLSGYASPKPHPVIRLQPVLPLFDLEVWRERLAGIWPRRGRG
jgi:hypothetical protein